MKNFWKRTASEKYLAVRALFWILFVKGLLHFVKVESIRKALSILFFRRKFIGQKATLEQIGWAFNSIAHEWPELSQCLERAIAAEAFCRQSGYEAEFRIGVSKPEKSFFQAHAWVEYNGVVIVNEDKHIHYNPFLKDVG